ncbi:MFS general substrate transporter [Thelephora ganbajun]|uniref:MFS general substrate transporter n=1 Tax=Thelephora ganbajun TaxID=370292 RepID=A0ACB6ZTT8_THEGA|nr:MFS general substrate transporter [Thelephora ganbajun]
MPPSLRKLRLGFTCLSIVLNALCAGGVLTFPLMSPALATRMKFTQPQLTSIVLAGIVGQYPAAPLIGKLVDYYGPWLCSLIASVLFTSTFSLSAWTYALTPQGLDHPSSLSFGILVTCFCLAGLAQACSFFSLLFAATKNFPSLIGIASGTSMVMFGLSPLFLSFFATNIFTDSQSGLDLAHYLTFLALVGGTVNLFGACVLTVPDSHVVLETIDEASQASIDETTSLLSGPRKCDGEVHVIAVREPDEVSLADLIKDPYFWILFVFMSLTVGCTEMVQSNIGTITLSLPPVSSAVSEVLPEVTIATQVRLFAIANTVSRLLSGTFADILSPVARYLPSGMYCFTKKQRLSRVLFLSFSAVVLTFSFAWTEVAVRTQRAIWVLSIGAGLVNGSVFNIVPGILSSIWGIQNLGRNFGVLVLSPLLGTPLFSLLYSYVAASHTDSGICEGVHCWRLTFWVNAGCAIIALALSLLLWSRWKDRV